MDNPELLATLGTQHTDKNATKKTKIMPNTDPTQKGGEPICSRMINSSCHSVSATCGVQTCFCCRNIVDAEACIQVTTLMVNTNSFFSEHILHMRIQFFYCKWFFSQIQLNEWFWCRCESNVTVTIKWEISDCFLDCLSKSVQRYRLLKVSV